jgi:hypothetical protein
MGIARYYFPVFDKTVFQRSYCSKNRARTLEREPFVQKIERVKIFFWMKGTKIADQRLIDVGS